MIFSSFIKRDISNIKLILIDYDVFRVFRSSVGEWLGHSLTVLGVDGSSHIDVIVWTLPMPNG